MSDGNAKRILIASIDAIKEFDDKYDDDNEYVDKAATKCKYFVQWLFLAASKDSEIEKIFIKFVVVLHWP